MRKGGGWHNAKGEFLRTGQVIGDFRGTARGGVVDSTAWVGTSRIVTVPTHCLSSSNGAAMSRPSGRPCPPVAASLCGDAPDWGAVRTVAGEMRLADSRWGGGPRMGEGPFCRTLRRGDRRRETCFGPHLTRQGPRQVPGWTHKGKEGTAPFIPLQVFCFQVFIVSAESTYGST